MTKQLSFAKYEQELRAEYRQKMNSAESTEDVKKFFVYSALELLSKVLERKVTLQYQDVYLDPNRKGSFVISHGLWSIQDFVSAWNNSDLPHIMKRTAEFAIKRYKSLETHRDKTEAKMYPPPGHKPS
jgi:hypothetical protein